MQSACKRVYKNIAKFFKDIGKDVAEQVKRYGNNAFVDSCKQIVSIFVFFLLMTSSLLQLTE